MKKYKAVLFDFDGVIGMTMEDTARAWEYALSRHNIGFDKNEYFLLEGLNAKKVVEHFADHTGISGIDIEGIVNLKEEYYIDNNNFSFYEGSVPLLARLRNSGYLLGLVTAANYIRLSKMVNGEVLGSFMDILRQREK